MTITQYDSSGKVIGVLEYPDSTLEALSSNNADADGTSVGIWDHYHLLAVVPWHGRLEISSS